MGAALNVVAGSEMYMVYETSPQNATIEQRGPQVRRFQALFVAGTHYKIRQATSLGLEFTGVLRRNQPFSWLAPTFLSSVCDCIVNGNPFWMQSLAISLRHNILR